MVARGNFVGVVGSRNTVRVVANRNSVGGFARRSDYSFVVVVTSDYTVDFVTRDE